MTPSHHPLAALSDAPAAVHLGDLARGDQHWSVYLEIQPDGGVVRGRAHFVDGSRRRTTAWIFVELHERDIIARFSELSAVELWKVVESLD